MLSPVLAMTVALAAAFGDDFEFRGTGWVNSKEMSVDRLKGKIVVLVFFEEN